MPNPYSVAAVGNERSPAISIRRAVCYRVGAILTVSESYLPFPERQMTRGARSSAYIAIIISVSVFSIGSPCHGTVSGNVKRDDHLIALASAKFSNLTRCERAVLEFADYATAGSGGDWPECGGASDVDDPINDPSHADRWDHQRDIRADLIRWLFVDPDASRRVDPQGISAVGARG